MTSPSENAAITILIIDDKPANIYALEKLLEKPGVRFLSATNGKDGLKLALSHDIDLVILDVQMPDMDGFEVSQVLQSHNRTREIPVIFASAEKKERHSIMQGFAEGAVDYLSKPLDPDLTRAKVAVLLKTQLQKKELVAKNISLEKAESEIRRLNADLEKNLARLKEANRELESFSYSVSHDLRAPLRTIIGFSAVLQEDCADRLGDEGSRAVGIIRRNAERMNKLIDDLLEFSRLGRKSIVKTAIDFKDLVHLVVRDVEASSVHRPCVTVGHLHPAHADYALMTQVWFNLISNAFKYSSKKEQPSIEIGSEKKGNEIIYHVKDNGAGFDMNYADKLFGVFQRLHKAEEFEGTGVGLALVHRIVSRHGGRIWAEGKPGEGATFYFSLPDTPSVATEGQALQNISLT